MTLRQRVDGVNPHRHNHLGELFYVLAGSAHVLAGGSLIASGLSHAAASGHDADRLIVVTPGVERFAYFRHLARSTRATTPGSPASRRALAHTSLSHAASGRSSEGSTRPSR